MVDSTTWHGWTECGNKQAADSKTFCGFQVNQFRKGTEGSLRVEGGFLGDPVGSFVGSLPCVLLCALTIEEAALSG